MCDVTRGIFKTFSTKIYIRFRNNAARKMQWNPVITTWFMRNLVYNVRYSVIPINCALLTVILYYSVRTTLVYNDTRYSVDFMTLLTEFDCK